MKNSSTVNVLLAVLAASAFASLILCWMFTSKSQQLRLAVQSQQVMSRYANVYNALVNDVMEYGKTHPAINPIIETYIKPKTAPTGAPTNKPSK